MCYDCDDAREPKRSARAVDLDSERLEWAIHLVTEHGEFGSRGSTACYHQRGTTLLPDSLMAAPIMREYDRITRGDAR